MKERTRNRAAVVLLWPAYQACASRASASAPGRKTTESTSLPAELALNLAPRDRGPRVSYVLGQAAIDLGNEFRLNWERLIALSLGQTAPESYG